MHLSLSLQHKGILESGRYQYKHTQTRNIELKCLILVNFFSNFFKTLSFLSGFFLKKNKKQTSCCVTAFSLPPVHDVWTAHKNLHPVRRPQALLVHRLLFQKVSSNTRNTEIRPHMTEKQHLGPN